MAVVGVDFVNLISIQGVGVYQVLNVDVLVGENHGGVSVVISGGLAVDDLDVLGDLVFIDLEEEIGLSLNITIDILSKAVSLFSLELLLEVQGIEFLLHQGADSALDLLEVVVVALLNFGNLSEDALLLLGRSERGEPFGLGSILLRFLFQVGLGVLLQVLEIAAVESGIDLAIELGRLSRLLSLDEVLNGYSTEGAVRRLEHARQEGFVCS